MSSFQRRIPTTATPIPIGARPSLSSPSVALLSSGVPSLDDVLGGGIPLGGVVVLLAPDLHSAWGNLLQRYFIAQGLASNQAVCVVSNQSKALVEGSMWIAGSNAKATDTTQSIGDELNEKDDDPDTKIKIAWRYEKMNQFQTTVSSACEYRHSTDCICVEQLLYYDAAQDYTASFDLSTKIQPSIVSDAIESGQLSSLEVTGDPNSIIRRVRELAASRAFQYVFCHTLDVLTIFMFS
jgi:elongator complex protein 4